ncbi:MAG: DUF4861 family protein, partial [Planctomycetota bacterium]|nr:DUF4861 family protein [Planctomycetota bacterium]
MVDGKEDSRRMKTVTIGALALLMFASPPAAVRAGTGELDAYRQRVAAATWREAREIRVRNPAGIADTIAVIVPVRDAAALSFAVLDEAGRPLVTQTDDLDGDGSADEVCFLLAVEAGQERVVSLLSGQTDVSPL